MTMNIALLTEETSSVSESTAFISEVNVPMALLLSLICIIVVIAILALIIGVCSAFFKGIATADGMKHINAKKENKILDEDEDAAVALICATIDFHKETGKEPRCVSIKRVD